MPKLKRSCITQKVLFFSPFCVCRLLVSASQDGKLIVWDSYTTNKVKSAKRQTKNTACLQLEDLSELEMKVD